MVENSHLRTLLISLGKENAVQLHLDINWDTESLTFDVRALTEAPIAGGDGVQRNKAFTLLAVFR